jgi:hypothetical protein
MISKVMIFFSHLFHLNPQPLLLNEKGCKNHPFNFPAPLLQERGWGEVS